MLFSRTFSGNLDLCFLHPCIWHFSWFCVSRLINYTSFLAICPGKITNTETLKPAGPSSLCTLLRQCRLQWLRLVCRMWGWMHVPKDILYRHLASHEQESDMTHRTAVYNFLQKRYDSSWCQYLSWENIAANQHQQRTTTNSKHLAASEEYKATGWHRGWKHTPQRECVIRKWKLQMCYRCICDCHAHTRSL